jgi:hypothetical protein
VASNNAKVVAVVIERKAASRGCVYRIVMKNGDVIFLSITLRLIIVLSANNSDACHRMNFGSLLLIRPMANLYQLMEQQTETTLHLNVVMITPEQT